MMDVWGRTTFALTFGRNDCKQLSPVSPHGKHCIHSIHMGTSSYCNRPSLEISFDSWRVDKLVSMLMSLPPLPYSDRKFQSVIPLNHTVQYADDTPHGIIDKTWNDTAGSGIGAELEEVVPTGGTQHGCWQLLLLKSTWGKWIHPAYLHFQYLLCIEARCIFPIPSSAVPYSKLYRRSPKRSQMPCK